MSYSLVKKFLFSLDPETAHFMALESLRWLSCARVIPLNQTAGFEVMGLRFPNRVGIAAGLDKNGDYIDALATLGAGFIEVGTITPKPQEGNPKPRLFRLVPEEAIINRMGFNNKGMDYLAARLEKIRYRGILGINIGKNFSTPIEKASDDYLACFKRLAPYASYMTINISSPNTPGLRDLQHAELLNHLLSLLKKGQLDFLQQQKKYVPLAVKISPDLSEAELALMADIFLAHSVDAVIATNTTLSRAGVEHSAFAEEAGGLSGRPLKAHSNEIVFQLAKFLNGQIPIIGCGGIFSLEDAEEKLAAGAQLIQVYSGLIYNGPGWLKKLAERMFYVARQCS